MALTEGLRAQVLDPQQTIINQLQTQGLLALFLVGTIAHEEERHTQSDIDFFGIVTDDFKPELEKVLNEQLKKEEKQRGRECRFRAFRESFLSGGEPKTDIQKFIGSARTVQRLRHAEQVWGTKIEWSKYLEPMQLHEEAEFLIERLEQSIQDIRKGKIIAPIKDFPKLQIELVRVEAQMKGYPYTPHRAPLKKFFDSENDHILHESLRMLRGKHNHEEYLSFCNELEKYVKAMRQQI